MNDFNMDFTPIKYISDRLMILDQTKLPGIEDWIELKTKEDVWHAIHDLKVRGAPAIGVAGAFGIVVSLQSELSKLTKDIGQNEFDKLFREIKEYLSSSRPTAVNLFWALDRIENKLITLREQGTHDSKKIMGEMLSEAEKIKTEDEAACQSMGEFGLSLLKPGMGILTHCNAGALATTRLGTCLAPIYLGHALGYDFKVYADETRPLLQGARLTSWELTRAGVDTTLICDNMAATVMSQGKIDAVVVGCDRLAANGDAANKIGTSCLAILAHEFSIPFYVFAPTSTIDLSTRTGDEIPIEEREGSEIYEMWFNESIAPAGVKTYNPAFDVTPAKYITKIITEKGIFDAGEDLSIVKMQGDC